MGEKGLVAKSLHIFVKEKIQTLADVMTVLWVLGLWVDLIFCRCMESRSKKKRAIPTNMEVQMGICIRKDMGHPPHLRSHHRWAVGCIQGHRCTCKCQSGSCRSFLCFHSHQYHPHTHSDLEDRDICLYSYLINGSWFAVWMWHWHRPRNDHDIVRKFSAWH